MILNLLGTESTSYSTISIMFQRLVLRDEGKAVPHKPGSEVHALPARLGLVAVGDLVVVIAGQNEARA